MSVLNSFENGTTFIDSITAGVFQAVGNATTGVPLGIPLVYMWKPISSRGILSTPDTNPNFATSKGAYVNLNQSKLASPFEVVNYEVLLDVCRIVKITASEPFTCFASCRDFYGQRMTFGGTSSVVDTVNTFVAPRGASAICSVKVSGGVGLTDVQITVMDRIELPFADYNQAPVAFINYDQRPFLAAFNEDATPYSAKSLYDLTQSKLGKDQTLSENCVRPIFSFREIEGIDPVPFDGNKILTIGQNVSGYGFNIPIPSEEGLDDALTYQERNPFLNLGSYVLGEASYSVGWEGWKS